MQTATQSPRPSRASRLSLALAVAACLASLGAAAEPRATLPPDAVALFDGKDLSGWQHAGSGAPARWRLVDGAMEVVPRTGSIQTKARFRDFQLHVEFNVPLMPDARGQARGNSGVYLQGLYEIQVLDSYGLKPGTGDCGAIYGQAPPMVNACRPPQEWQSYDILFHAARFDPAGTLLERARVSVLQNGFWIHDNVPVGDRNTDALRPDAHKAGPVLLQDHGNPVRFRNLWLRPLPETGVSQ